MNLLHIILLAVIQGACELLPVSSSAHVIVVEKLLGIDPTRPEWVLLLVALHTGTMFAVIVYFWRSWRTHYFSSRAALARTCWQVIVATVVTAVVGEALVLLIEKVALRGSEHAEVEQLFGNLTLVAAALAAVGVLILAAGGRDRALAGSGPGREDARPTSPAGGPARAGTGIETGTGEDDQPDVRRSCWIGAVQGLCLPFRGFSRSGATISTGLLLGLTRGQAERFSFALAVVLTPPVIARAALRVLRPHHAHAAGAAVTTTTAADGLGTAAAAGTDAAGAGAGHIASGTVFLSALIGMGCAFVAGYLALRLLSGLLERGRWWIFGWYCLAAAAVVLALQFTYFH